MNYNDEDDEAVIVIIAESVAWMYNFKLVDKEEIRAAVRDLTLTVSVSDNYVQKVYLKYLEMLKLKSNAEAG